jgi:hypothetical protein
MPTISEFYGIYIQMYFDDKHGPHFHAIYAEHDALVSITDGKIMAGYLPNRAERLVRDWWRLHRSELMANWEHARRGEKLAHIPGLD